MPKRTRLKRSNGTVRKKRLNVLAQLPKPPANMKLLKIDKFVVPHPYCITPKHLELGRMYLDKAALRDAEQQLGAKCDICRKRVRKGLQADVLSIDEHKEQKALVMEVPKGDLNEMPELKKYLLKIKPLLKKFNIEGVAFKQV